MNALQRLLSNTILAFIANTIARVSSSILFIFIGREIGPQAAGVFNLGVTYYTILLALSTLGFHELLVREVAPRRDESNRYLTNYIIMRLATSLALFLGLLLFLQLSLPYSEETKSVLRIMSLAIFPEAIFSLCQALFIAHERQAAPTLSALLNAAIRLGLGLFLLRQGAGAVAVAWVIPISTTISLLVFPPAIVALARRTPQSVSARFDFRFSMQQLRMTSGFVLLELFQTFNFQADTFIISILMTEADIGYYGASQTILAGVLMIPMALRMALYPLMARVDSENGNKLRYLYHKASQYTLMIGIPLAAGVTILAAPIIEFLFGPDFGPAIPALQISIWSIVFDLATVPNARLMLVKGRQTPASWLRGAGAVASVGFNLLLISRFGINGAALARVLATAIFFLALYVYVQRNLLKDSILHLVIRPVLAAVGMSLVVWYLQDSSLLISIPAGIVVYGILIVLLGGVSEEDKAYFRQLWVFKPET
jgi:O-antigen/teichoic acid export membrane protein